MNLKKLSMHAASVSILLSLTLTSAAPALAGSYSDNGYGGYGNNWGGDRYDGHGKNKRKNCNNDHRRSYVSGWNNWDNDCDDRNWNSNQYGWGNNWDNDWNDRNWKHKKNKKKNKNFDRGCFPNNRW